MRPARKPKKSLGQYILKCHWVVSTLVKTAEVGPEDMILEIGPGTGVLTRALAKHAKKVIAVEKDERLAEELKNCFKKEEIKNVEIITGDILHVLGDVLRVLGLALDTSQAKPRTRGYKVVSNIPYYLTSRLLRLLLENEPRPESIVLTIQKEVAERIVAKPPKMNLLALSVQVFGTPKIIKRVPATCFSPKPKIESAIIKISDISDTLFREHTIDPKVFFGIAGAAFSQKRKILTNNLTKLGLKKTDIINALVQSGIKKTRAEEFSKEDWIKLVKTWYPPTSIIQNQTF